MGERVRNRIFLVCIIVVFVAVMIALGIFIAVILDDATEESTYNPVIYASFFMVYFCLLASISNDLSKKRRLLLVKKIRKNKLKGESKMAFPTFIKELVGKTVSISTISSYFKGAVEEVSEDWIKLTKQTKKGSVSFLVKEDMITNITIL